jgi:hypothetical protein
MHRRRSEHNPTPVAPLIKPRPPEAHHPPLGKKAARAHECNDRKLMLLKPPAYNETLDKRQFIIGRDMRRGLRVGRAPPSEAITQLDSLSKRPVEHTFLHDDTASAALLSWRLIRVWVIRHSHKWRYRPTLHHRSPRTVQRAQLWLLLYLRYSGV